MRHFVVENVWTIVPANPAYFGADMAENLGENLDVGLDISNRLFNLHIKWCGLRPHGRLIWIKFQDTFGSDHASQTVVGSRPWKGRWAPHIRSSWNAGLRSMYFFNLPGLLAIYRPTGTTECRLASLFVCFASVSCVRAVMFVFNDICEKPETCRYSSWSCRIERFEQIRKSKVSRCAILICFIDAHLRSFSYGYRDQYYTVGHKMSTFSLLVSYNTYYRQSAGTVKSVTRSVGVVNNNSRCWETLRDAISSGGRKRQLVGRRTIPYRMRSLAGVEQAMQN